jgi:hypothetical protein
LLGKALERCGLILAADASLASHKLQPRREVVSAVSRREDRTINFVGRYIEGRGRGDGL